MNLTLIQLFHIKVVWKGKHLVKKSHIFPSKCPSVVDLRKKTKLDNRKSKKVENLSDKPGTSFKTKPPDAIRPPPFQPGTQTDLHIMCKDLPTQAPTGFLNSQDPAGWIGRPSALASPSTTPSLRVVLGSSPRTKVIFRCASISCFQVVSQ